MVSFLDVFDHERVVFESLDLLLLGLEVTGEFFEFG